jgi:membrane protein
MSLYALFADPATVERQMEDLLAAAPDEVREVAAAQLSSIADTAGGGLGLTAIIGIVVALWSASTGMKHLIAAINVAYDEDETRKFFRLRGLALLLTLGAIVFFIVAVALIAFLPNLLDGVGLGAAATVAVVAAQWLLLTVGMMVALAILYRYAPDRDNPEWKWTSAGAIIATIVWILGSVAFSIYTANFGSYNETYGSLGAVIIVMLWLLITSLAIVLGAEINCELERQTSVDTTVGDEQPIGNREAHAADTVGPRVGAGDREPARRR